MTIKEIAVTTAKLLGLTDVARAMEDGGEAHVEESEKLVCAVNRTIRSVAVKYLPPETEQTFDGREAVDFTEFLQIPISIRAVTGADGKSKKYAVRGQTLFVPREKVVVRYRFLPPFSSAEDECCYSESLLPREVISAGAAAEYCISEGRYEDADFWADYFRQGILSATKKPRRIKVRRDWL